MATKPPRGSASAGKPTGKARRADASETANDLIHGVLPPREVVLRFIAEHPEKASKRELAKAFGLKGEQRVELKELLRTLEDDGLV